MRTECDRQIAPGLLTPRTRALIFGTAAIAVGRSFSAGLRFRPPQSVRASTTSARRWLCDDLVRPPRTSLLIAIALAADVGGVATPIGTGANRITAAAGGLRSSDPLKQGLIIIIAGYVLVALAGPWCRAWLAFHAPTVVRCVSADYFAGTSTASTTCTHPFDARTDATILAPPIHVAPSLCEIVSVVPSTIIKGPSCSSLASSAEVVTW